MAGVRGEGRRESPQDCAPSTPRVPLRFRWMDFQWILEDEKLTSLNHVLVTYHGNKIGSRDLRTRVGVGGVVRVALSAAETHQTTASEEGGKGCHNLLLISMFLLISGFWGLSSLIYKLKVIGS